MKKDFLTKLGLADDIADKILAENTKDIESEKGNFTAVQTKLTTAESELTALKTQLTERNGQLEILKNSTGDIEAMKKQIADLQAENKSKDEVHSAEVKQLKINAAVDAALATAKAKNTKAVKALLELDYEKTEIGEDGCIKGLDEQIKKLQGADDSKFLFDNDVKKPIIKGAKPGESGREEPDGKVDISKMSYEELAAYMEQNPDAEI